MEWPGQRSATGAVAHRLDARGRERLHAGEAQQCRRQVNKSEETLAEFSGREPARPGEDELGDDHAFEQVAVAAGLQRAGALVRTVEGPAQARDMRLERLARGGRRRLPADGDVGVLGHVERVEAGVLRRPGHREEGSLFAAHAAVAISNARALLEKDAQVSQLEEGLQTRTMIGQATGLLMAQEGLSSDEAFQKLVAVSQNSNMKLRELPDRDGLLELNTVIARACRHDFKDRYISAAAMRADHRPS